MTRRTATRQPRSPAVQETAGEHGRRAESAADGDDLDAALVALAFALRDYAVELRER